MMLDIHDESVAWRRVKCMTTTKDMVLKLRLNETIYYLATANIVGWYDQVSSKEGGSVLRRALEFYVEGQSMI